jgi:DNA-directed RNA polymerase specialized sigma24 family protein
MFFKDWIEKQESFTDQELEQQMNSFVDVLMETFTGNNELTDAANVILWSTDLRNKGKIPLDAEKAGFDEESLMNRVPEAEKILYSQDFLNLIQRLANKRFSQIMSYDDRLDLASDVFLKLKEILTERGTRSEEKQVPFKSYVSRKIKQMGIDSLRAKRSREKIGKTGLVMKGDEGEERDVVSMAPDLSKDPTSNIEIEEIVNKAIDIMKRSVQNGPIKAALIQLYMGKTPTEDEKGNPVLDEDGFPVFALGQHAKNPDFGLLGGGGDKRIRTEFGRALNKPSAGLNPMLDPEKAEVKSLTIKELTQYWNHLTGRHDKTEWIASVLREAKKNLKNIFIKMGMQGINLDPTEEKPEREFRPEPKPEIRPEPKPEFRPEPKPEFRPEPKPEFRPEPKPEFRPVPVTARERPPKQQTLFPDKKSFNDFLGGQKLQDAIERFVNKHRQ